MNTERKNILLNKIKNKRRKMMKVRNRKIIIVILIIAFIISVLNIAFATANTNSWADSYVVTEMSYVTESNFWKGANGQYPSSVSLNADPSVIAVATYSNERVVISYTMQKDGILALNSGSWLWASDNGDGSAVAMYLNNTAVMARSVIKGMVACTFTTLSYTVIQGDKLYIVVDANETSDYDYLKLWIDFTLTPSNGSDVITDNTQSFYNGTLHTEWSYQVYLPITLAPIGEKVTTSSYYKNMTWDTTNNIWKGTENYVCVAKGTHYGVLSGNTEDVAVVYKAPKAGTITFNETGLLFWCSGGGASNGIGATILYNDNILMARQVVLNGDAIDPMKGLSVSVTANDEIIFMVDANGSNDSDFTHLFINMTLTPDDGSSATSAIFQEQFSGVQGQDNWYYRSYFESEEILAGNEIIDFYTKDLTLNSNNWKGSEEYSFFCPTGVLPGNSENLAAIYEFAKDGKADFSQVPNFFTGSDMGWSGDGVGITILLNNKILVSRQVITKNMEYNPFAGKYLNVTAGDKLIFLFDSNASNSDDFIVCNSAFTLTPTDGSEKIEASYQSDYSLVQNQKQWSYLLYCTYNYAVIGEADATVYTIADMTWDSTNNIWKGAEEYVNASKGTHYGVLAGNSKNVAIVYKAPKAGILTFNETGLLFWCSGAVGSNGIGATILYNNKILMARQVVENGAAIDPMKGLSLKVSAEDEIIFMVDANGNKDYDFTHLFINMTFASTDQSAAISANFQEQFSGIQGQNNWFYRCYTADVDDEITADGEELNYLSKNLTFASELWKGSEQYSWFSVNGVLPGNNEKLAAIYGFTKAGKVTFSQNASFFSGAGMGWNGDGVGITVLLNNKVLVERKIVTKNMEYNPFTDSFINVNADDKLVFLFDCNSTNSEDWIDFNIEFTLIPTDLSEAITANYNTEYSSLTENKWSYVNYQSLDYIQPSADTLDLVGTDLTYNAETMEWTTNIEGSFSGFSLSQYENGSENYYPAITLNYNEAIALRYTVSVSGSLLIDNNRVALWCSGGNNCNGVGITILLNNKIIVARTLLKDSIPAGDVSALAVILGKALKVEAGDIFTVLVDPNGSNDFDRLITFIKLSEIDAVGNIVKTADIFSQMPTLDSSWSLKAVTSVETSEMNIISENPEEYVMSADAKTITFNKFESTYAKYTENQDGSAKYSFEGDNYCFIYKGNNIIGLMAAEKYSIGITYHITATGNLYFYNNDMFIGGTYQGNYMGVTVLLNDKVLFERTLITAKDKFNFFRDKFIKVAEGDKITFLFDANANNFYDSLDVNIKGYIIPTDNSANIDFNLYNDFKDLQYGDNTTTDWSYFFCEFIEQIPDFSNITVGETDNEITYGTYDGYLISRDVSWKNYNRIYGSNWDSDLAAGVIGGCPGKEWSLAYVLTFNEAGRVKFDPQSYIELISENSKAADGIRFCILLNNSKVISDWKRLYSDSEINIMKTFMDIAVFNVAASDKLTILIDKNETSGYDSFLMEINVHFAKDGENYTKTYSTRYDFNRLAEGGAYNGTAWRVDKVQLSEVADTGTYSGHEASFFVEEEPKPSEELIVNNNKGCNSSNNVSVAVIILGCLLFLIKNRTK
jgi:hypothetical protein